MCLSRSSPPTNALSASSHAATARSATGSAVSGSARKKSIWAAVCFWQERYSAMPDTVALADKYVHVDTSGVPFCRVLLKNRPATLSASEELALLSEAFGKVGYGKILVECESPVALSPTCLANIKFMNQIRDTWNAAGNPNVTFLTPPAILRPILHTLEIPYTLL